MAFTKEQINHLREYNEARNLLRSSATIKECFYYDKTTCSNKIIKAHSLQREGPFPILEKTQGDQKYVFNHAEIDFTEKGEDYKKLGRGQASTFNGFCGKHDTELFAEIENNYDSINIDSDRHCFLLTYRAYAQSYHSCVEELKFYESKDERTISLIRSLHTQEELEIILMGLRLGIADLSKTKAQMDQAIKNKDNSTFEYFVVELPYTVPIATASMVTPWVTIKNKEINRSPKELSSVLITTVLPFKSRSIIVVAAFANEGTSVKILDDLDKAAEIQWQRYLSFLLMHEENFFIAPAFFDTKTEGWKRDYIKTQQRFDDKSIPISSFNGALKLNFFDRREALTIKKEV